MALTRTTLAAPCSADDLLLLVTAATGAAPNCLVQIGDEFCVCTGVDAAANTVKVRSRGSMGTRAKAHAITAAVTFGLAADFTNDPIIVPPEWDVREAAVNQDFDPGALGGKNLTRNTEVVIVKAGVYLQTLSQPTLAQDGLKVRWVSASANAHVIGTTAANSGIGFTGALAGTFAATGGSLGVRAQNGRWCVIESYGISLA
jgi:hypothetical protein